jgi:hypothetical protein
MGCVRRVDATRGNQGSLDTWGKVKEAENTITTLPRRDPLTMLAACCGQSINLTTDQYPILKRIKDRTHFRNILFHQLNVASKKQLQLLSDILGFTLANPKMAFGKLAVRASEMNSAMRLGDPLVDLRKLKRIYPFLATQLGTHDAGLIQRRLP